MSSVGLAKEDITPGFGELTGITPRGAKDGRPTSGGEGGGGHYPRSAGRLTAASGASCMEMPLRQVATPNGRI